MQPQHALLSSEGNLEVVAIRYIDLRKLGGVFAKLGGEAQHALHSGPAFFDGIGRAYTGEHGQMATILGLGQNPAVLIDHSEMRPSQNDEGDWRALPHAHPQELWP